MPKHVRRYAKTGKFRAVVTDGRGRRHYGSLRDTPDEAAEDAAELKAALRSPSRRGPTLADAMVALRRDLAENGSRPATLEFYQRHWRTVTGETGWSLNTPLDELTVDQVQRYAAKRLATGVSMSTVWTMEVYTLQRCLRAAMRLGVISRYPLDGLRRPKIRKGRFGVVSKATFEKALAAIRSSTAGAPKTRERDALLFELFFCSGLRRSEVARLTVDSVDFDARRLFVDGKAADEYVPLSKRLARVMRSMTEGLGPTDPIIGGKAPEFLINHIFRRWRKRLSAKFPGLAWTPHSLRHGFATALVEAGVLPFQLVALMRHRDPKQSLRYFHASDVAQQDALDALGD